jgi:hypothetical protein
VSAETLETVELYRRFKTLAVAASASLILDDRAHDLRPAVDELHRDAAGTPCEEPATRLRQLVHEALRGEVSNDVLDAVRSSHRALRREVWATQRCEYVPCCAADTHQHR